MTHIWNVKRASMETLIHLRTVKRILTLHRVSPLSEEEAKRAALWVVERHRMNGGPKWKRFFQSNIDEKFVGERVWNESPQYSVEVYDRLIDPLESIIGKDFDGEINEFIRAKYRSLK